MQTNIQDTISKKNKKKLISVKSQESPAASEVHSNDNEARDALIEKYMPFATSLATKMSRTLPSEVDYDDVLCNARLGLLEAAKRFDAKFGVDFKTFAYYRIKGAIYDGLRKTGWIPRSLYSKIKFEQAANEYLAANEKRMDGLSAFYKRELAEVGDSINSVASIYVMSIDGMENFEIKDTEANKDMERRAEFQKIKEKVCDAIEGLPDKERKLIKMYYFQNKTLEEIGQQLDLSKSWTSRLHARALEMLFKKVSCINQQSQVA